MSGEKTLRKYVAQQLKAHGHVSQVESGATASGIPDTNFFDKETGRDIWIELKYGAPKKPWELRKTQVAWIRARIRKGGMVFLLLKYGGKEDCTYTLIKLDSEEKLDKLNHNQNILAWAMQSQREWTTRIPNDELIQELRK